jgi:DNA-directed RNA polymerase subunit RPC12/RpoP
MSAETSIQHPPGESARSADEGIRCLHCGYNLTGITSERCPECGAPFDRAELLASTAGAPAPIPIWDDRETVGYLHAFLRTVAAVCLTPRRYLRRMPPNPSIESARAFCLTCYLVAAAIGIVPAVFDLTLLVAVVPLVVGGLTAMAFMQLTLATALLGEDDVKLRKGVGAFNQRSASIRMMAAHLPVIASTMTIFASVVLINQGNVMRTFTRWGQIPVAITAGLWLFGIITIIREFEVRSRDVALSLLMLPMLLAVAGMVGASASALVIGLFWLISLAW